MVVVRSFRPDDESAVVAIWDDAFPGGPPRNAPSAYIARKVERDPELLWVAEDEGAVVGVVVAGYDGVRGWLYHLAVAPTHRRKGIATSLIERAVESLRALGCIKVNLQVRRDKEDVRAMYEALGWVEDPVVSMGRLLDCPALRAAGTD